MSGFEQRSLLGSTSADLGPAILIQLDNEAVLQYRLSYRRFRMGEARGAEGESPKEDDTSRKILAPNLPVEDGMEDLLGLSGEFDRNAQAFEQLSKYRMEYRRHRMGGAHGAKGEVTALSVHISKTSSTQQLPVAQLHALARFRAAAVLESISSTFHLHVGAGKLGLGLVIPAIDASGKPYAVVQRPSSSWSPILEKTEKPVVVGLRVNGEAVISRLVVVKENLGEEFRAKHGKAKVFACTTSESILEALVDKATTLSVSLGPVMVSVMLPLLKHLPHAPPGKRPCLYACENDHTAVEALKEALEGRVDVVSCMVDRICTDRTITPEWIEMGTEASPGEIVVITPPSGAPLPPFTGKHVQIPRIPAEAEYFCRRKILMVNGMHTTLAFVTLCKKEPGGLSGNGWKEHVLVTPATATEEEGKVIWLWAVARLMYVAWEHEPSVIKAAHDLETDLELCEVLLAYARATLSRFSGVEDKAGRVLGGGVANRFEGRLNMIRSFLSGEPPMRSGLRAKLLQLAGVTEGDMRNAVDSLVTKSRRFVGINVAKPQAKVVVT